MHTPHFPNRRNSLHEQPKIWALNSLRADAKLVRISQALPSHTYYDPVTKQPMYPRVNHPTCPSFCFTPDYEDIRLPIHNCERSRPQSFLHLQIIREIVQQQKIILTHDKKKLTALLSDARAEVVPEAPHNVWRLDVRANIDRPPLMKAQFGGKLAIEVICSNPIHPVKAEALRGLPYAIAVVIPPKDMVEEFADAEGELEGASTEYLLEWHDVMAGYVTEFLEDGDHAGLFHIPNERPSTRKRAVARGYDPRREIGHHQPTDPASDLSTLVMPPSEAPPTQTTERYGGDSNTTPQSPFNETDSTRDSSKRHAPDEGERSPPTSGIWGRIRRWLGF